MLLSLYFCRSSAYLRSQCLPQTCGGEWLHPRKRPVPILHNAQSSFVSPPQTPFRTISGVYLLMLCKFGDYKQVLVFCGVRINQEINQISFP